MANFDDIVKESFNGLVEDGTVAKIFAETLSAGVKKGIEDSFKYGDLSKALDTRIKEVMVPYIENYDFGEYVSKLDMILAEIVNKTCLIDNKTILENFKQLMIEPTEKTITLSQLFTEYNKQVAENIETYSREVATDSYDSDGPDYVDVETYFEFEREEDRSWSSFKYATVTFGVRDEDEQEHALNRSIKLTRYEYSGSKLKDNEWELSIPGVGDIESLRNMHSFDVLLCKLHRANVKIIVDTESDYDSVTPDEKPEPSWS